MLSELLHALRDTPEPLGAEALAISLNKDTEVVEAMLGELVAMGHIRAVADLDACAGCRARTICGIRAPSGPGYILVHG